MCFRLNELFTRKLYGNHWKYNGFSIQQVTTFGTRCLGWSKVTFLYGGEENYFQSIYCDGAVVLCNKAWCYHTCCLALSLNNMQTKKKNDTHIKKSAQIAPPSPYANLTAGLFSNSVHEIVYSEFFLQAFVRITNF